MNPKIKDLIKSCNDCILSCETVLKTCKSCIKSCIKTSCSANLVEDCSVNCQKLIDACRQCMHQCNQILENKLYQTSKQEAALKNCLEACQNSIKRCQATTTKILDKDTLLGCQWSLDSLNKCISACDECIESLKG